MRLNIINLTKRFGSHVVLNKTSVHIDNVNTLVIIGPSGGGKTTLLRIIAGLESPEGGTIEVNNHPIPTDTEQDIEHSPIMRAYRKKIGVVFQAYNLFPHLTALQNITLPLIKVHQLSEQEANDRATHLLSRFKLGEHAHKKPFKLSGGQKQRIAIARAISLQPEYLLLDEPTSALDPEFTSEVLEMIEELKHQTDIIIVTHHLGFARSSADHMFFVSNQKILENGHPNDIFDRPQSPELKNFFSKVLAH